MKEIKFIINGKMDLYWNDEVYKTDIQEINDKYISISMPMANGRLLPLGAGDRLELIYYQELFLYKFDVKVLDRYFDGKIHQIYIEYPKTWTKIQRRDYVRVTNVEYIKIVLLEKLKEGDTEKDLELHKALLIDLSGGGMKFKFDKLLEDGEKIMVFINNSNVNLKIPGKIVRRIKDDDGRYAYGVKFEDINDSIREIIIQHVFSLMRKQMKNE